MICKPTYSPQFLVKDNCLYETGINRSGAFERKLCNFALWIESEVAVCDGEQTVNHARLKGLHESGRILETITIPAEDVLSLNWLHKHWGLDCMIEPVRGARSSILRALQSSVEYASKERLYSVTGWTNVDGKLQYLMPGNESVSVMLQGKLHGYHMEHSWTIDDICSTSQLLRSHPAPVEVIFPLLAVTFLSPLNHFLKDARCEPKFVVFLMGKTGSRKSTLAALMLSFYGRFTASELPLSFRDTANSIQYNAYALKDVLTVIDDFHPSNRQDESKMNNTAQIIMRGFGDRVGRGRLTSDCVPSNARAPQGNAIITGEFPPDIGESGTARYFTVEIKENDVDLALLSDYQRKADDGVFSRCMFSYIQWLENKFLSSEESHREYVSALRKWFEQRRDRFTKSGIRCHGRVAETVAWLQMGLDHLLLFLKDMGVLDGNSAAVLQEQFRDILYRHARKQANSIAQDKPTHKFIRNLFALMESGQVILLPKNTVENFVPNNCLGYEDEDTIYLYSELSHKTVKKFCEEQGESFSLTSKALLKAMAEEGLIDTCSGQNTKSVRIAGKSKRLVCLSKEKSRKIIEEGL